MSCSPFIPSVFPHRPPIKLLLISPSVFFLPCMFHSLSTLSGADSRRGTRDTEGGSTDKTRVVNSTRRKPTHLSLSTARLPANLGSSWNSFGLRRLLSLVSFFYFVTTDFLLKFWLIHLFIYKILIQCLLDRYSSIFIYLISFTLYYLIYINFLYQILVSSWIIQCLKFYFGNHVEYFSLFRQVY